MEGKVGEIGEEVEEKAKEGEEKGRRTESRKRRTGTVLKQRHIEEFPKGSYRSKGPILISALCGLLSVHKSIGHNALICPKTL